VRDGIEELVLEPVGPDLCARPLRLHAGERPG